jgi:hypothetical protein
MGLGTCNQIPLLTLSVVHNLASEEHVFEPRRYNVYVTHTSTVLRSIGYSPPRIHVHT